MAAHGYVTPATSQKTRYSTPVTLTGRELLERRRLGLFQTWKHNRELDAERARMLSRVIADGVVADPWVLGPQPVYVVIVEGMTTGYLIDGQHRVEAIAQLANPEAVKLFYAEIEVTSVNRIDAEFVKINSGTPVPARYWDQKIDQAFSDFLDRLQANYKAEAPADQKRVNRPRYLRAKALDRLNECTALREAIRERDVTGEQIFQSALKVNEMFKTFYRGLAPAGCIKTADRLKFYLGLSENYTWVVAVADDAAANVAPGDKNMN